MADADLSSHAASHSFRKAFELLCIDLERVFEFVEPDDANLSVYSHRLYELHLRACTEFESVCKEALLAAEIELPKRPTIVHYQMLEPLLGLERMQVQCNPWRSGSGLDAPFRAWTTSAPALSWYDAYNKVKHGRHQAFRYASLENVRASLAGLFTLLAQCNVLPAYGPEMQVAVGIGYVEIFFPSLPTFSLRAPSWDDLGPADHST